MAVSKNKPTDIIPIVKEINALREQHTREYEQTRDLLKSVVEEIRGIREELQEIKKVVEGLLTPEPPEDTTHTPRTIAERYVAGTTEADRDEVARKVVELRINTTGSRPLAWRKIRERLGLKYDEFHKVIRLSIGYRKAVIDRIKSLRAQEGGWEYSGNLERLTGIELTEKELS